MPAQKNRIAEEPLEPLILTVRGQRVILDAELARVYGVSTKALNQAIKRNPGRFPVDFVFQLSASDLVNLRSQSVISKENIPENQSDKLRWSQIVTTSQKYRRSGLNPWVFAEHGAANAAILKRLAEIDNTLLQHDAALRDVYRRLQPLLAPPPATPKRRIGF